VSEAVVACVCVCVCVHCVAADIDGLLPHVADGQKGLCIPKSFSVQLGAQLTASPTLTCVLRDSTHHTD